MGDTNIEWTDKTWNPIRGCSKVSEGCRNCYAASVAARFSGPGMPYEGLARRDAAGNPQWTGLVRMVPKHLEDPIRWKAPRRIFVNSMSDLFHEDLEEANIAAIFAVMAAAPQHQYQVLTKRPTRMAKIVGDDTFLAAVRGIAKLQYGVQGFPWPLPHVWLGTSVENQEALGERLPHLLATPAAIRFLSVEPQLGRVSLPRLSAFTAPLHWIIVGGESGKAHRPFDPEWARLLRDQCEALGIAFFFKQHGGLRPTDGGDLLDGVQHHAFPEAM